MKGPCAIEDCAKPRKYRELCDTHYHRRWKTGTTDLPARPTPEDRFWRKVDAAGVCWEWTAGVDRHGYGRFSGTAAYRWAYRHLVGPIEPGLELDHLCRNPACVNPDHLEPVTHRVNVLRGMGPSARRARQTACSRGHEFTPENTYRWRNHRFCVECRRMTERTRVRAA
jgi:hypothetical protein